MMRVERLVLVAALLWMSQVSCLASPSPPVASPYTQSRSPHQHVQHNKPQPSRASKVTPATASATMAYYIEPQHHPTPLYDAKAQIKAYHETPTSATNPRSAYDTEVDLVMTNARTYARSIQVSNQSVWIFDIDETSLSGYTEMASLDFGYIAKLNHEWVLSAIAPAINHTLALYLDVLDSGARVIFLTGRRDTECDASAKNLKQAGYYQFDQVICRTPSEYSLTAEQFKTNRRTDLATKHGYDIVGCVGDQYSDLNGGYTGFRVKLPNYIYFLA